MNLEAKKILVVDDEEDIRDFLEVILTREGAIVAKAIHGKDAIDKVTAFKPHLIILDKLMPELNGFETCQLIRNIKNISQPKIVMLSAMGDEESQIEGLDTGADDYLLKPIKANLLISKLNSILRSSIDSELTDEISYKYITVDRSKYRVSLNKNSSNVEIVLPKKEFELFFLLISKPDFVFKRDDILANVWGKDIVIGDRTIDVHIRKLREKIGEEYFKSVKGIGYKFVAF